MAKKIYYGQKAFPGGMPRVTDHKQGRPQQQTYYDGYPVTYSYVHHDDPAALDHIGTKTASVTFEDGTDRGYNVTTETFGDGERYINELGERNGVTVDIDRVYSPKGIELQNDTSYNGLTRGDIGFEQLQRQFEMPIQKQEETQYPGTPDSGVNNQTAAQPNFWQRWINALRTGISGPIFGRTQQHKQGGKLTEVWTPFN